MPNALVLGASGTLGGAIARTLLARGMNVGLHYNQNKVACDQIVEWDAKCIADNPEIQPRKILSYSADFNDVAAPAALLAQFLKDFGSIDYVVWASGISRDAALLNQNEADLRAVLNVNLKACVLLFKAISRQFIKQKSGTVVVLSSHAAVAGRSGGCAYAMAEAGLLALVKSAAREWGALGVNVNAVIPPFVVDSKMGSAASADFAEAVKARQVLKPANDDVRLIAKAVLAAFTPSMSGQIITADSRIA